MASSLEQLHELVNQVDVQSKKTTKKAKTECRKYLMEICKLAKKMRAECLPPKESTPPKETATEPTPESTEPTPSEPTKEPETATELEIMPFQRSKKR